MAPRAITIAENLRFCHCRHWKRNPGPVEQSGEPASQQRRPETSPKTSSIRLSLGKDTQNIFSAIKENNFSSRATTNSLEETRTGSRRE